MAETAVEGTGLASLKSELESLVDEFERNSQELAPGDDSLQAWRKRAGALGKRLRESDTAGKNKLLLKLQRFQTRLRAMRAARDRYESQREQLRPLLGAVASLEPTSGLEYPRRAPLAAAIRGAYGREPSYPLSAPVPAPAKTIDAPSGANGIPREAIREVTAASWEETPRVADATVEAPAAVPARRWTDRRGGQVLPFPVPRTGRLATRQDPIVAVLARLGKPASFADARAVAGDWLRRKGFRLPEDDSGTFEVEGSRNGDRAIAIGSPGVWAMQADTVDTSGSGRRWRVEMVLIDALPTPAVSVTLTSIAPADQAAPTPSVPVLVAQLIERVGLLDPESGEALAAEPTMVNEAKALERLLMSLQSPLRRMPIIVLSTYFKQDQPDKPAHLLDPVGLSRRLRGIAKVYVLTRETSWGLTDALSRRFAVAGASARLFRSGFTSEDDPLRHPQWGPDVLHDQNLNLKGLSDLLEREAAAASLRALEQEDAIPPFDRVRAQVLRRQIEQAREQAKLAPASTERDAQQVRELQTALDNETKLREMFEEDNATQVQELTRLRAERDQFDQDRDTWRSREYHLEARIAGLKRLLREAHVEEVVELPDDWDGIEAWCQQFLGDRVYVTPKAIRAARSSKFENVPFCYKVLLFLAETYVPVRRGTLDAGGARLEEEKRRLRIDVSPVGQAATMHRLQDTYTVGYNGRTVPLDMHVSGPSQRDPRKVFRMYFYWDTELQRVVVGWFPGHLENRLS